MEIIADIKDKICSFGSYMLFFLKRDFINSRGSFFSIIGLCVNPVNLIHFFLCIERNLRLFIFKCDYAKGSHTS